MGFHVRRMMLSAALYGVLIASLVFGAVQLQLHAFPGFFPITWQFSDPMSELPVDLLIFHFALPYTLDYFKPREVSGGFPCGCMGAVVAGRISDGGPSFLPTVERGRTCAADLQGRACAMASLHHARAALVRVCHRRSPPRRGPAEQLDVGGAELRLVPSCRLSRPQ